MAPTTAHSEATTINAITANDIPCAEPGICAAGTDDALTTPATSSESTTTEATLVVSGGGGGDDDDDDDVVYSVVGTSKCRL